MYMVTKGRVVALFVLPYLCAPTTFFYLCLQNTNCYNFVKVTRKP